MTKERTYTQLTLVGLDMVFEKVVREANLRVYFWCQNGDGGANKHKKHWFTADIFVAGMETLDDLEGIDLECVMISKGNAIAHAMDKMGCSYMRNWGTVNTELINN